MTTFQDCSVGYKAESTFATYATPDRWVEFTKESLKWAPNRKQGKGMRVGSRVARSARRVTPTAQGAGDIEFEIAAKGQGTLWEAAMGSSQSNLVSGGLYQQLHQFGDSLNSLTVQKGLPQVDGTVDPYSFLGCTVDSFEIDSPNDDLLMAKVTLDCADYTTAQSYASPSYSAEPQDLFHFGQGVAEIGGTLTVPTTTALASTSGEITVGVRDFNLQVTNNVNVGRFNYGNSGRKAQQVIGGYREIKGKFTAEYDQTTLRDAFLNDTDVPLLFTWTGGTIGAGNAVFQVVLPVARLDGDVPEANDGDLITIDHNFTVLDGLTDDPLYLVQTTSDTAL